MNRLHIYLPAPLIEKLRKKSQKHQISLSELIRHAVQDLLLKK